MLMYDWIHSPCNRRPTTLLTHDLCHIMEQGGREREEDDIAYIPLHPHILDGVYEQSNYLSVSAGYLHLITPSSRSLWWLNDAITGVSPVFRHRNLQCKLSHTVASWMLHSPLSDGAVPCILCVACFAICIHLRTRTRSYCSVAMLESDPGAGACEVVCGLRYWTI